jgi:hypothetical protein
MYNCVLKRNVRNCELFSVSLSDFHSSGKLGRFLQHKSLRTSSHSYKCALMCVCEYNHVSHKRVASSSSSSTARVLSETSARAFAPTLAFRLRLSKMINRTPHQRSTALHTEFWKFHQVCAGKNLWFFESWTTTSPVSYISKVEVEQLIYGSHAWSLWAAMAFCTGTCSPRLQDTWNGVNL